MPSKIKIVKELEIRYEKVYRDYPTMQSKDLIDKLYHYDTDKPILEGKIVDNKIFRANAALYDRKWDRDFELEAHSQGNWRMTVGISCAAFLIGGILGGVAGYYAPHQQPKK
jgi:hypothetical protein